MSEQSHEFSAKSVETAIEDGLRQLGVSRDRVDVEVLHEGSRGLLGIGSTNARVHLTLRVAPTPVARSTPAPAPVSVKPTAPPVAAPEPAVLPVAPVAAVVAAVNEEEDEDDLSESAPDAADSGDDDEAHDDEAHDDRTYDDMDQDEVVALAGEMLLEMVSLMGLNAEVESSQRQEPDENEAAIYLNLVGDDLDVLIGRHGETIASMQYLIRLMVNQKLHRWTNIVVDVEGYKDRRADKLAQMALRMADQVIETGKPVALEPMPANERRLIHIALRDHPQVYTESIGEDTRRKIQILLK